MSQTIFSFPGSHAIIDGKRVEAKSIKAALKAIAPKAEAKEPEAPKAPEAKPDPKAEAKPK